MSRFASLKNLTVGTVLLGGMILGGSGMVLAQDDTAEPAVSHPAHIHNGDCANLDPNPAAPLNNVEPRLNDSDEDNANQPQGILTAAPVLYSDSEDVDMSFDDMLAESHSINVHESNEDIQTYIACGEIGGVVVDGKLVIALHPQNDSGHYGIAILEKDDDGNVDVEIYLTEPMSDENTPAATPVS